MSNERDCQEIQRLLTDAFYARAQAADDARAHVEACDACAVHARDLETIASALAALPEPELRPSLAQVTLRSAQNELARSQEATRQVPEGYRAELMRLVACAALPLPLVVLWNFLVLSFGAEFLSAWLSSSTLWLLGSAYVLTAAMWLAALYGSLPFVATRLAQRRLLEVST